MKFDLSGAVKAKESGNFLSAGIKNAKFNGVEFATVTSQKSGDVFKTMALKLDVDGYGEYTQNFFEPQSDERQELQWGLSASQLDHFLITVREILEAVNPQSIKDIDEGKVKLSGTFKQVVDSVKELTTPYIGTEVQVKFIPGNNGYVSMPSYTARITKNGDLGIATRIIGHDLTLTASEVKKIEAAQNARPTNMSSKVNVTDVLSDMDDDIKTDNTDDLPF